MLYFIGNKGTLVLLQDDKGSFYAVSVNNGKLVVEREQRPILYEFNLKSGVMELPFLEVYQHVTSRKLYLYDRELQGDVKNVGTENDAFSYTPGWLSLCPTCNGYKYEDMCKAVPSKLFPDWEWRCYEDGSGSLHSPDRSYFSYELSHNTNLVEYRDLEGKWKYFEAHMEVKGSVLEQFMAFAEECIKKALF